MAAPASILELYCGIGGCASALPKEFKVVGAVDINQKALALYSLNFRHPTFTKTIESLDIRTYQAWNADLWWMSPPCQPHTIRGKRQDLDDTRSNSLVKVIEMFGRVKPRYIAIENVPGFASSAARSSLIERLESAGYRYREIELCPTQLGIPNRRRRYFLTAGLNEIMEFPSFPEKQKSLQSFLDDKADPDLFVGESLLDKYKHALHIVEKTDANAVTACFTSAYGRSFVRSGSYLKEESGRVRRFSPREIARLLGFPENFRFPSGTTPKDLWPLLGNSLSVDCVRYVLKAFRF